MLMPKLITALITPFLNDKVDIEGLKENIRFQIENGIKGLLVLGTTGESPTLTQKEKKDLIKAAVELAKGKASVIVGTGSNCTKSTIENTLEAKELGADAALIITPYYNCPTQEGVYQHFKAIVHATDIPICLYNHPKRTNVHISVQTLKKIASLKNVFGVKEVSIDLNHLAHAIGEISVVHPNFSVWAGDDAMAIPMMSLGAYGVISVASNLVPKQMAQMIQSASQGNFYESQQQFYLLHPLFEALFLETNPIGIKAAMKICGMPAGDLRLPLTEMGYENQEKLKKVIDRLNIACAMR